MKDIDKITRRLTAFNSFDELLNAAPDYTPTLLARAAGARTLIKAYNKAMRARGDKRTAYVLQKGEK